MHAQGEGWRYQLRLPLWPVTLTLGVQLGDEAQQQQQQEGGGEQPAAQHGPADHGAAWGTAAAVRKQQPVLQAVRVDVGTAQVEAAVVAAAEVVPAAQQQPVAPLPPSMIATAATMLGVQVAGDAFAEQCGSPAQPIPAMQAGQSSNNPLFDEERQRTLGEGQPAGGKPEESVAAGAAAASEPAAFSSAAPPLQAAVDEGSLGGVHVRAVHFEAKAAAAGGRLLAQLAAAPCARRSGPTRQQREAFSEAHGDVPHSWQLNEKTRRWEPVLLPAPGCACLAARSLG